MNSLPSTWHPIEGNLITRWAFDINPEKPWPEYPRPQLQRENWINLNGEWDYAITNISKSNQEITKWDGKILVPYPVESALSGVKRSLSPKQQIWYRRTFLLPEDWIKNYKFPETSNILLYFGGVDWETTVWINDQHIGTHQGGDIPFSFDISKALYQDPEKPNKIVISVWDPTDKGKQERSN
jgi:beta-galactosidase/beta-glucuronidase